MMEALVQCNPRRGLTGIEVVEAIGNKIGTHTPSLATLERLGYVMSGLHSEIEGHECELEPQAPGQLRRRFYFITERGRTARAALIVEGKWLSSKEGNM